jgi:hypothetical protein
VAKATSVPWILQHGLHTSSWQNAWQTAGHAYHAVRQLPSYSTAAVTADVQSCHSTALLPGRGWAGAPDAIYGLCGSTGACLCIQHVLIPVGVAVCAAVHEGAG